MQILKCLAIVSLIAASYGAKEEGENWAVVVAGSNGWSNYRHQAGACHAYQVLHDHGIPDDHIVVMMYDDLADNSMNPTPGVIINQPNGKNVYENIVKDYTEFDVTKKNFLKVLQGDEEGMAGIGSGKVIKSGPNDKIFINLVDHGNVGLFAFPTGRYLYTDDLYNVVQSMYDNNMYDQMVIFMESCESGSMFEDMYPDNINFYSTTSANSSESSYATYYDDERSTYIGDLFGVCWMENSDENDLNTLTLGEQYNAVEECNNLSHTMWFGQQSIQDEVVGTFLGTGSAAKKTSSPKYHSKTKDLVRSEDVPLAILQKKLLKASGNQKKLIEHQLQTLLDRRQLVHETTKTITSLVTGDLALAQEFMLKGTRKITNWDCYKKAVDAFSDKCFNISYNPYALTMMPTLLNLCETGYKSHNIVNAIKDVCNFDALTGIE